MKPAQFTQDINMACRSNTKIQKILWILIVLLSEQIESDDVDTNECEFYVKFA